MLPDFFKNEDELRSIWSKPDTRKKLLQGLNEKGFSISQLQDLKVLIKQLTRQPAYKAADINERAQQILLKEKMQK